MALSIIYKAPDATLTAWTNFFSEQLFAIKSTMYQWKISLNNKFKNYPELRVIAQFMNEPAVLHMNDAGID